jgi:hypothetical protein
MGSRDEVRVAGRWSVRSVIRLMLRAVVWQKKLHDSSVKNVKRVRGAE